MNRKNLQGLAKIRLNEAKTLLDNGLYDGIYYLCGYAVECALKACIAKNVKQYDFPDKKVVNDSHTHVVSTLVKVAGLTIELEKQSQLNDDFKLNWQVVRDWSEVSRYKRNSQLEAEDIYSAITHRKNGIMQWIKKYW
ncbi:HEPN domain-containing protein [Catalinimonas alkaloidigena]|uniref:HEPN domain-containing protein n=1 Tax=Catalinimonas alkaloidigena TaxID=1075417 RepID=UPI002406EA3F|nr:HEPN domain-containing protein [Catalinimonas alkaloidigena]MDF9801055.1 HEPN domain-containing protein [Catalinimonas alkaloidigena]